MQIWKPLCLCSHKTWPWKFHILDLKFFSYLPVEFVNFLKRRLILNIFYCFRMFVNKFSTYLTSAYLKKWKLFSGAVYRDETPHLGGTSHLSEVRFIPRLYEKNIHLSKTLFIPVSLHVYLLIYYFCFKFELLISIHTAWTNCTFSCNNYKNTSSLNYKWTILPRWDSLSKTVYMEKNHST